MSGWAAAAQAATEFIGGMMDRHSNRSMQDESINFQREMFDKGNAFNREMAEWGLGHSRTFRQEDKDFAIQQANREYERQKEFARMGIQWKMQDAQAAGLHPLAVLGGTGASYSPTISVMGSHGVPSASSAGVSGSSGGGGSDIGGAFSRAGQNLIRALTATETAEEREARELALEHARLRNRLLDAQITETYANIMGQPQNPPMASSRGPGVPVSGAIAVEPSKSVSHMPGSPHMEAARTPFGKTFDMGGGASIVLPSQAAAESLEALGPFAGPTALTLSGLRHWFHGPVDEPKASLPPGWSWKWDPFRQAFQPLPPQSQRLDSVFRRRGPSGPARGNRGQLIR